MKILTWSDFPKRCHDPQEKYGDFSGTILDLLNDDRIPNEDKIWAATRQGILDDKTLRLFACKCVREVWHLLTDERSKNAVITSEKFANGNATFDELTAAGVAAKAAWVAARDAWADTMDASSAAKDASSAATMDAWSAARGAWRAAAMDASSAAKDAWRAAAKDAWRAAAKDAWRAARAAAINKQVQLLITLIK